MRDPLPTAASSAHWSRVWHLIAFLAIGGGLAVPTNAQVPPDSLSAARIQQSVEAVLGGNHSVTWIPHPLSEADEKAIRSKLKGTASLPDTLHVGRVSTDEGIRFILPDAAPSKSKTFSLLLYLDETSSVVDVDVLKYRENYGYEVDYPMFREQFQGKNQPGEVQFRRSIRNISGATISARSMTHAVHDLLVIANQVDPLSSRSSAN